MKSAASWNATPWNLTGHTANIANISNIANIALSSS